MDATAKVSLDSSGYEAGARKISASDADMARSAKTSFAEVGDAAARAVGTMAANADKASRSYKELREQVNNLARDTEKASKAAGDSGGPMNSTMRSQMLMHSSRAVMDSIMAGQSPLRALEMEGPRLAEVAGLSMGATIGLSAVALAVSKLASAYHDAGEAKKEFDAAATFVNGGGTRPEAYRGEIEAVQKARDDFQEKTGGFASQFAESYWNALKRQFTDPVGLAKDLVTGKGAGNPNQKARDEDDSTRAQQITSYQSALVAKLGEENGLRERAARYGEESVKVAEIRQRKEEAITDARQRAAQIPGLSAEGEVREIERAAKIQEDAANLAVSKAGEQIRLESVLLGIRREGGNIELRTADARLASERTLLAMGPISGEDHDRSANRVGEDEEAVRRAVDTTISRQNQLWLTERSSRYGHGATRQYQEMSDRQFVLGNEIDANTAGTREDGSRVFKDDNLGAKQMSEAVQLKRAMDDFMHSQREQLDDAKASLL